MHCFFSSRPFFLLQLFLCSTAQAACTLATLPQDKLQFVNVSGCREDRGVSGKCTLRCLEGFEPENDTALLLCIPVSPMEPSGETEWTGIEDIPTCTPRWTCEATQPDLCPTMNPGESCAPRCFEEVTCPKAQEEEEEEEEEEVLFLDLGPPGCSCPSLMCLEDDDILPNDTCTAECPPYHNGTATTLVCNGTTGTLHGDSPNCSVALPEEGNVAVFGELQVLQLAGSFDASEAEGPAVFEVRPGTREGNFTLTGTSEGNDTYRVLPAQGEEGSLKLLILPSFRLNDSLVLVGFTLSPSELISLWGYHNGVGMVTLPRGQAVLLGNGEDYRARIFTMPGDDRTTIAPPTQPPLTNTPFLAPQYEEDSFCDRWCIAFLISGCIASALLLCLLITKPFCHMSEPTMDGRG